MHADLHTYSSTNTQTSMHTHEERKKDQECVSYFVITSKHLTKQIVLPVWGKIQSIMAKKTRQLDNQVAGHTASVLRRQGTDRKLEQEVKPQEHPSTNTTMSHFIQRGSTTFPRSFIHWGP